MLFITLAIRYKTLLLQVSHVIIITEIRGVLVRQLREVCGAVVSGFTMNSLVNSRGCRENKSGIAESATV